MKNRNLTIKVLGLFVATGAVASFADIMTTWSGGDQGCDIFSPETEWSIGGNWLGGTSPTANAVLIEASAFCNACSFCRCLDPGTGAICTGCVNSGDSCVDVSDCTSCDGASLTAVYDYTLSGNSDHTFSEVSVIADSSNNMTLRKAGDNPFFATSALVLIGDTTKKAILDVDQGALKPTDLTACQTTEIDVATGVSLVVQDELIAGVSTDDTTLTLKGSGTVDVTTSTRMNAFATMVSSTLVLDGSIKLLPASLEVFGASASPDKARFWQKSTTASIDFGIEPSRENSTLTGVKMRGYSEIDIDRNIASFVKNDIVVDTTTVTTDAHIFLFSNAATLEATNLNITAGASHTATLTMELGVLNIIGDTIIGAAGATQVAKLVIPSGGADPVLNDVVLKEKGVFDSGDNLTIAGTLTIEENADNADVVTLANKNLLADVVVFKKTTTFTPTLASGSTIATN